jgi:hypothetical protein
MKQTDHIVLLATAIKQDAGGRWVSTGLTEEDSIHGGPGGALRICAAALLLGEYPHLKIITGGAKGFDVREGVPEDRPLLADILRDELLESGVPEERIILQRNSNNTYQELQELERLVGELGLKRLIILTGRWHVERLHTMIDIKFPQLRGRVSLEVVTAEDVLIARDAEKWRSFIEGAYGSEWMAERMFKEQNGVLQIHAGTYHFREE